MGWFLRQPGSDRRDGGYVKDYLASGSGEPVGSNLHFDVSSTRQTNALFPALHDKPHLLPLKITPATDIHHPETLGRGGRRGGTRCFCAHRSDERTLHLESGFGC